MRHEADAVLEPGAGDQHCGLGLGRASRWYSGYKSFIEIEKSRSQVWVEWVLIEDDGRWFIMENEIGLHMIQLKKMRSYSDQ